MAYHKHATPNFRNLFIRPLWMTMKTALRTIPFIGKARFLRQHNSGDPYHAQPTEMLSDAEREKLTKIAHQSTTHAYAADRESTDVVPYLQRPVTVMYPYERLEDMEPWLFVPGNYNGRIGIIWETCTACKACVRICPNDCLHMTTETRVNVLDYTPEEGDDMHGYGVELEVGGLTARRIEGSEEVSEDFDLTTAHADAPQEFDFGEILDLSGDTATVRWDDSGATEEVATSDLVGAEVDIVSGRIDLGRCMFCGLCMESCPFNSFFMTNEYDGMSGHSREELWMDASRTRVLPTVHAECVDIELAKRVEQEQKKLARAAAKAAKASKGA